MFSADSSPEVGLQLGSVVSGCQSKMVESYMSRHRPYRHAHIRQEHCMNVCAQYVLRTVPCKCALQRALCMHLVQTLMQLAAADGDMQHVNAIMCIQAGCLALKQQLSSTPAAASQSEHLSQRLCARYTHTPVPPVETGALLADCKPCWCESLPALLGSWTADTFHRTGLGKADRAWDTLHISCSVSRAAVPMETYTPPCPWAMPCPRKASRSPGSGLAGSAMIAPTICIHFIALRVRVRVGHTQSVCPCSCHAQVMPEADAAMAGAKAKACAPAQMRPASVHAACSAMSP